MHSEIVTIVADKTCADIYDYCVSDKAEVILEDFSEDSMELKYVKAVNLHADIFIDSDKDTVSYFIENGILAVRL